MIAITQQSLLITPSLARSQGVKGRSLARLGLPLLTILLLPISAAVYCVTLFDIAIPPLAPLCLLCFAMYVHSFSFFRLDFLLTDLFMPTFSHFPRQLPAEGSTGAPAIDLNLLAKSSDYMVPSVDQPATNTFEMNICQQTKQAAKKCPDTTMICELDTGATDGCNCAGPGAKHSFSRRH